MKKKEKHTFYNFQFKHTAVSITNHPNILSADVSEALNIHPIMLYRWRQEMREGVLENNDQEARSRDKLIAAENKIKKLESELKRVRAENNVLKKAERLFVTPGGYYAWLKRKRSQHSIDDEILLRHIINAHKDNRELYGYPRIHQVIIKQGIKCGRNRS